MNKNTSKLSRFFFTVQYTLTYNSFLKHLKQFKKKKIEKHLS